MSHATPATILQQAADTIAQRGRERDTTRNGQAQERSMAATVAAFNAIEGTSLTERQGWAFMKLLKAARAAATARNGRYNADDYVDGSAYTALEAEAAQAQQPRQQWRTYPAPALEAEAAQARQHTPPAP